ncbi:hypothetical protein GCM10022243_00880 [Saccharothrix violaceirubra]|uniref:Lasso RiPP family leader peptide-containing protein n=1 Tax=Saccharothrix violaceirubra TaxID=413306 RepID=A0A7W7WVT7_9PSEU|nr:lasso RiPP family leader peptide-containing protein [Saccharothrix violaceirubra]MBB4965416.1 hypothetical protein [Saccharothrix violaceirubra]
MEEIKPGEYEQPLMVEIGDFAELTNGIGSQNPWDTAWLWD